MSGFRSLLPGPSRRSPAEASQHPPHDQTAAVSRRITIAAACECCRQRKVKCDGGRPCCSACLAASRDCQYKTEPSESRAAAFKRKHADLEERLTEYEELYHQLRTRSPQDVSDILERLRSGADVSSVLQYIKEATLLLQARVAPQAVPPTERRDVPREPRAFLESRDPYIASLISSGPRAEPFTDFRAASAAHPSTSLRLQHARDASYHSAQLVDPRLAQVRASAWTLVTSDDELVSKLLGKYFQWEFPIFQFFQKDLFLDDLVAGRKSFCSSLLVNAILASASHGYAEDPDGVRLETLGNLSYAFMAESKRLWELESGKRPLTTIQTASILSLRHMADGAERLGLGYIRQAVTMADAIDLFTRRESIDNRMSLARAVTAWGLFSWQGMCCCYMLKPPIVSEPPAMSLPDSSNAHAAIGELYVQYPYAQTLTPVFLSECFRAYVELRVLMTDLLRDRLPDQSRQVHLSLDQALRFRDRLNTWYRNLPLELQVDNLVYPHQIHIHIGYHLVLISLFEPWATPRNEVLDRNGRDDPAETFLTSRARLESLVRLYHVRYGFGGPDVLLLIYLLVLGTISFKSLTVKERSPAGLCTLYLCTRGLPDQDRNNHLGMVMFRVLLDLISPADPCLQGEFARIRAEETGVEGRHEHVRSEWPVYR